MSVSVYYCREIENNNDNMNVQRNLFNITHRVIAAKVREKMFKEHNTVNTIRIRQTWIIRAKKYMQY